LRSHAAFAAALRPGTRFVLAGTIGTPALTVADRPALADLAHSAGVPLVVDNTFVSPYLCRPGEWGADIVFHSATKYISGHGSVIGGVLVDVRTVDWAASGRFPGLTEPHVRCGGRVCAAHCGPGAV